MGHLEIVQALIDAAGENKALLFQPRMMDQLLFIIACQEGHLEIVQALIDAAGENKALLFQPTNDG